MNVLQICQRVAILANTAPPSTLININDNNGQTLKILFEETGNELVNKKNLRGTSFSFLQSVGYRFTTQPGVLSVTLPEDFKNLTSDTLWSLDGDIEKAKGPLAPAEWAHLKYSINQENTIIPIFRIISDSANPRHYSILFSEDQGETEFVLEYSSTRWLFNSDNLRITEITSDSDYTAFDSELMKLGTLWRYKQRLGQSFGVELAQYEERLDQELFDDASPAPINVNDAYNYNQEYLAIRLVD